MVGRRAYGRGPVWLCDRRMRRGDRVVILRPWFWLALVLVSLWAPVMVVETWIDPPADLATRR